MNPSDPQNPKRTLSEISHLIFIADVGGGLSQYQNRQFPIHAAGGEAEVRWQAGPGVLFSAWYAFSAV